MLGTWSKAAFKAKLQEGECLVTWERNDKTGTRSKHYTLKPELIPDMPNKRGRVNNPPLLTPSHTGCYDIRKDRWDGVKVKKVISVELVEE